MSTGQELTRALQGSAKRIGATTKYAALVATANENEVTLPAGANAGGFMGFETQDHADGDIASFHEDGGRALAVAASAFNPGDRLRIANAQGQLEKAHDTSQSVLQAALAVAANAATLANTARTLIAVKVTAGGVVGWFKIIPRGDVPATGQAALSADGKTVNFLAGDAVTAADIEYLESPQYVVAVAKGKAGAAGDVVAVNPVLGAFAG